nr:nitronate monooxygenase [Legionella beliardensis]
MWPNKLLKKIGITYPIIQAPMAGGATTPELVAAVSNAGGLGSLGAGYMSPNDIRQAIKKIRALTTKPFAVNLFIPGPYQVSASKIEKALKDINQCCPELELEISAIVEPYAQPFDKQMKVLIEEKIPIFSYTFGTLSPEWIAQLRKNNTILIGTATTLTEAQLLEESGIDVIVAQGAEAGGHRGTFIGRAEDALIGLLSLLPQLVDHITIPIIAAGAIMDGRGIMAAIDLGACGVQMGTAFLTCPESGIPEAYKKILLEQQKDNTVLTHVFSGKMARGIRNKFIECMSEKYILDYPVQNALTTMMRKKAKEKNNSEFMSLWAGQSANLCRKMTAEELIRILIAETENVAKQYKSLNS